MSIRRIKNSQKIERKDITTIFVDNEELQFSVKSSDNNDEYFVTCKCNLWRCDCYDYINKGLNHAEGSFLCKHIIAIISMIFESNDK
jgi:hypothetical protein